MKLVNKEQTDGLSGKYQKETEEEMSTTIRAKIRNLLINAVLIAGILAGLNLYSLRSTSALIDHADWLNSVAESMSEIEALKNRFLLKMETETAQQTLMAVHKLMEFLKENDAGHDARYDALLFLQHAVRAGSLLDHQSGIDDSSAID